MTLKEEFYREVENYRASGQFESETLLWYDAANDLSVNNAKVYRVLIVILAICGGLFALSFLLYFSVFGFDNYNSFSILILLLAIISIYLWARKKQYHKKYLEYRVLAESLRIQDYISKAGIDERISGRLPLLIQNDIGWVKEVLEELPLDHHEMQPILHFWIEDQLNYHQSAIKKANRKKKFYDNLSDLSIVLTVASYFTILVLELLILNRVIVEDILILSPSDLKFYLGLISVVALLYNSIYGKKSLPEMIGNHERMISLYYDAKKEIGEKGESVELTLFLADECLIENSLWYAFQKQNKIELVL